jgi:hypothetical protein
VRRSTLIIATLWRPARQGLSSEARRESGTWRKFTTLRGPHALASSVSAEASAYGAPPASCRRVRRLGFGLVCARVFRLQSALSALPPPRREQEHEGGTDC